MVDLQPKPRGRRLWLWFLNGFIIAFIGMLLGLKMHSMLPSGRAVVEVPLWAYYMTELRRAMASPRVLGPASVSVGTPLLVACQHLFLSTVGGATFAGIGWTVSRFRRRNAPIIAAEQALDDPVPADPPGPASFRDVPWSWRDVLIGLAPLVAVIALSHLVSPRRLAYGPNRLWIPFTVLAMVWMFAYPLQATRRRIGLPPLPRLRAVLVEALLTVPVFWFVMTIVSVVSMVMVQFFGNAAMPSAPLEPIAASSDRVQQLALIFLAVFVAPFNEELFFRGMLYNALRQRLSLFLAAVLQAVVFGLIHPFGFAERAAITVIGFCIALLYEWRKTLLAPILLHGAINAVAMGVMFWGIAAAANGPMLGIRVDAHEKGCLITEVAPGSAAEESGLRVGDVIAAVDGEPVADARGLIRLVRAKHVGEEVAIDYIRGGEAFRVEATLKGRPKSKASGGDIPALRR